MLHDENQVCRRQSPPCALWCVVHRGQLRPPARWQHLAIVRCGRRLRERLRLWHRVGLWPPDAASHNRRNHRPRVHTVAPLAVVMAQRCPSHAPAQNRVSQQSVPHPRSRPAVHLRQTPPAHRHRAPWHRHQPRDVRCAADANRRQLQASRG